MTGASPAFAVVAALSAEEAARASRVMRDQRPLPRADALAATATGMAVAAGGTGAAVATGLVAVGGAWAVALALLLAFMAGLTVMLVLLMRHQRRQLWAMLDQPMVREPRRFEFGEDGIAVLGASADAHWRWRAFTAARREAGLLVLLAGATRSVAIPERAFSDEAATAAALAYVLARIAPPPFPN